MIASFSLVAQLWRLTHDMRLENKEGIMIFPDKKWIIANEGHIRVQDTDEVLGFNDERTGKLT